MNDVKKNLVRITNDPAKFAKEVTVDKLVETLKELSYYYYNTGEPLVSDSIYDILRDALEEKDPKNKFLQEIGAPVSKNKVNLPYPMSSLDKIKPGTEALDNWKKKYKGPYVISDKLDGVSGLFYKDNDQLKLFTRGDAFTGQDISHLIKFLLKGKYKPGKIPNKCAIRGEIVMSKKNFVKISDEYKNARNAVAGLVNAKHFSVKVAKLTDFIAYAIVHPRYKQEEQMKKLAEWEFPTVTHKIEKNITNQTLSVYLEERRKTSEYEVDGVVVIDTDKVYQISEKNPDYGFAFKMVFNDQVAEAKVLDVVWNITKRGSLKPVVVIEPVDLVGVTIKHVTAFNAKFVVDNKLGPGAVVKLIRSGDVIPHIISVIKGADKPKMPDIPYKWNKTNVDIVVQDVHGSAQDNIIIKKLTDFFKVMGISYISEGIVTKLVQHGYKSVSSILTADFEELAEIEGIGQKLLLKIFKNTKDAFDKTNLQTIMAASNCFGFGLGTRKLKIIVDAYPNIMNEKWSKKELKDKILQLHGFDEITSSLFVDGFDSFKHFLNELEKIDWLNISRLKLPQKESTKGDLFKNQKIVFTGFRSKELEQFIINNGGEISSGVSKNTTLLIYVEGETTNSKYIKAQDLKIPTVTKDEFEKKYVKK